MSVRSSAPLQCSLPDGLTLRTVRDARDVARVASLASVVFGPEVGLLEEHLLARFPGMEPADQFFVETADGEVVSMLCLIPWTWRYGPVSLTVGEMGIVATDPAYRRRGLVRAQVDAFKQRLAQRGCVLSCIQGIPHYYRQFGYDYALPLEGGLTLELRHAPEDVDHGYRVRAATPDDLDALAALYDQTAAGLPLHAARGHDVWRFLLGPEPEGHATIHRTWVICAGDGQVVGYARLPQFHFGEELVVDEASTLSLEAAQTLLSDLRRDAAQGGQPAIRLHLPVQHDLTRLARALGGHDLGTYAWQIHCPDLVALLQALVPALNERLADSLFHGYTQRVRLGTYRQSLALQIVAGRIVAVEAMGRDEETDFSLPMQALIPLLLGHQTLDEVRAAYPDTGVHGIWRLFVETLFPKVQAFIYPGY